MIEISGEEVEVVNVGVIELCDELMLLFLADAGGKGEAGLPFVENVFDRSAGEAAAKAVFKRFQNSGVEAIAAEAQAEAKIRENPTTQRRI